MQPFRFPLQRLLNFKRQRQRQEELSQQESRTRLEVARSQVSALLNKLKAAARAQLPTAGQPLRPETRIEGFQHLLRISESVETAEEQVRRREKELAEADDRRRNATTEAEALEILRDRGLARHKKRLVARTHDQLDETAMRKWSRSGPPEENSSSTAGNTPCSSN